MSTDETTAGTPGTVGAAGGGAPVRVTVPAGDAGDTAPGTAVVFEDPWRTAAADTAASDTAAGDTADPDAPPTGP
ncbi:hypothetical protein, partial [Corynebacterium bovis]